MLTILSPMKAIRAKCLECCDGSSIEVNACVVYDCPLFQYRFGRNPKRTGIGNKGGNIESLARAREAMRARKAKEDKQSGGSVLEFKGYSDMETLDQ